MTPTVVTGAVVLGVVMAGSAGLAADQGCKGNRALTGACYIVRGDVFLTADIGPALSVTGQRALIIRAAPNSQLDMPENVGNALSDDLHAEIEGMYEVCPIPEQPSQFPPGITRYICINSASGVVVHHPTDIQR